MSVDSICPFCGETYFLEVLEYFPEDRSLLLDTCCEAIHEFALSTMPLCDRTELKSWFRSSTGLRIRQIIITENYPNWCVDQGLTLCDITWPEARDFIAEHHQHNRPPQGWKFGKGLKSGDELVAVMTAGRPVAPQLDHRKVLEVTRVCVKELTPRELGWNACSILYGFACREGAARGLKRAVAYTRLDEPGTSLIAAGFVRDGITTGGSWHRKSRPRPNAPEGCIKKRWRRDFGRKVVKMPLQLELLKAA